MNKEIIVGAGSTGLTAANELVRLGIKIKIINKNTHRSVHSKALGVHAGTLENFEQSFGKEFSQAMVSLGLKGLKAQNIFFKIDDSKFINVVSLFNSVCMDLV